MIGDSNLPKQMAESIDNLTPPKEEQLRRFGSTVHVYISDNQLVVTGSPTSMHQLDHSVEPLIGTPETIVT
jgi:hypothetical protein